MTISPLDCVSLQAKEVLTKPSVLCLESCKAEPRWERDAVPQELRELKLLQTRRVCQLLDYGVVSTARVVSVGT